MSLWTPDGEHPVRPDGDDDAPADLHGDVGFDDLDDETRAQVEDQLAQAQAQLLAAPVDQVVSNHVMGLFELAALHLRVEDPDLDAARLPIDAMGLLVDNLGDRLADHDTLNAALTQLRMAYVQVKKAVEAEASSGESGSEGDEGAEDELIEESDFLD